MSLTDMTGLSCPLDTPLPVMFDWADVMVNSESEPVQSTPVDPREQFIQDVERFYGALFDEVSRRARQTQSLKESFGDVMAAGDKSLSAMRMCFTEAIKDSELAREICQILVSDHGRNRLRLDRRCDVSFEDIRQFYSVVLEAESESTQPLGPAYKREQRKAERQKRRAIVVPRLNVRAAAEFLIQNFSGDAGEALAMKKVAGDLAMDLGLGDSETKFHEVDGRVELRFYLDLAFMDKCNLAGGTQQKIIRIIGALAEVMKERGVDVPSAMHESLGRVRSFHGPQVMSRYDFGAHGYLKTFKKHGVVIMTTEFANHVREFLSSYYVEQ